MDDREREFTEDIYPNSDKTKKAPDFEADNFDTDGASIPQENKTENLQGDAELSAEEPDNSDYGDNFNEQTGDEDDYENEEFENPDYDSVYGNGGKSRRSSAQSSRSAKGSSRGSKGKKGAKGVGHYGGRPEEI